MLFKPFVKTFKLCNKYYMYEVNTNDVIKISKELYDYLMHSNNVISDDVDDTVKNEVNTLIEQGFLIDKHPCTIEHTETPILRSILANNLGKLTLQVTQSCNFKCRYCGYAGDSYLNRSHSNLSMTWETAKKSIDFFISHSGMSRIVEIGFYGGEPFLELDLITKCIEYCEEKMAGKTIRYFITTNATLINQMVIDLLNKYNIFLTISLDGPKELHNKNRRFAINGEGTFDKVFAAIKLLCESVTNVSKNVNINAVVDREENIEEYYGFFENELFTSNGIIVKYSYIDDSLLSDNMPNSEEFVYSMKKNTLDKYLRYYSSKEFYDESFEEIEDNFDKYQSLPDTIHHGGPCIPGASRLMVTVMGDLKPCERCSEKSSVLSIGNIYAGFDIDRVSDLLNIGKLTEDSCKKCFAIRSCRICAARIDNINSLSIKHKLKLCEQQKSELIENLKKHVIISHKL